MFSKMEDDLKSVSKWKTTSDLLKLGDNLYFFENGRRPDFFQNGKRPQFFQNGRRPQFLDMEEDLKFFEIGRQPNKNNQNQSKVKTMVVAPLRVT